MMPPKYAIVVTTINDGRFLPAYLANLREHGHLADTRLYVVGDRKTPPACRAAADAAARDGLDCPYLGVEEQTAFLRDLPAIDRIVPWNSDNRRNVGFLMALRDGAEVVISIDDDNLPVPGTDFVGGHAVTGRELEAPEVSAASGWYNLFDVLEHTPALPVWPRGYPYRLRAPQQVETRLARRRVHVNAGLWLGDPDVDAITRIAIHPDVKRMAQERGLLAAGTFSPINTQNTAVHRDAMVAYYYVRMHEPMHGARLNRFGDIWSGYFVQKCAKALGHAVAFGAPPVEQVRNDHDLFVDLREEYWGIVLSEHLSGWLTGARLSGSTYATLYGDLADRLVEHVKTLAIPAVNHEVLAYFAKIRDAMHVWLEAVARWA
jgi:hypothetical protein